MSIEKMKKIERYLRKCPYGFKQPELFINLTYQCPLRCKFCYVNYKRDGSFSKEDLEYLFENVILGSNYIKLITFFGGEPLVEYELVEYILDKYYDKCCQENIHLAIITSMAINGDKLLKLQEKYPYFEIVISFDHYSGGRIYGNGKPFKVLEHYSPEELQNHRRNICFHLVIDNPDSFKDLKLCQEMFTKYGLLYSWCWNKTPRQSFDVSEYYYCLKRIIKEKHYYPKQFITELDRFLNRNGGGCGIGSELFISANGDISPCSISHYNNQFLLMDKGKIRKNEPEIIQNYEENIFMNDTCYNCDLKGFCNGGCIIDRLKIDDIGTPNHHLCDLQKQIYKIYKRLDAKYNLGLKQKLITDESIGNLDYCHNTSINIDMYDYFKLKG